MAEITPEERAAGHELHKDLQMHMAGRPVGVCVIALTNSMSAMCGYVSETIEDADRFIDKLAIDLKEEVRVNWDYLCEMKTQARVTGTA